MSSDSNLNARLQPGAEYFREAFRKLEPLMTLARSFATELDWLGDAADHPPGSEHRKLAEVRDEVDLIFSRFVLNAKIVARLRAETSRSIDLLLTVAQTARGDGPDALHLMRRYHDLADDECDPEIDPGPESLADSFAWDAYLRVSALTRLARERPKHLRHSARQMHGWPMIVSRHIDHSAEFENLSENLELGDGFPLDVSRRKKRGTGTPLLEYLEPLIWRLHVIHSEFRETNAAGGREEFTKRLYGLWWEYPDPAPSEEIISVLQRVPGLPVLTRATSREWSHDAVVPVIMLTDAGDSESCRVSALRNIWNHRSVKSRATFQSRLHSAVCATLKRFGRPDEI